ncbi:helix-turn-helix domain-containing protein [Candidatus Gottesmanbacteria bacterium]|nr:helix-turn-helix domain-containing protein [Candidatus Gottesmanbacteria bacterium]
MGRKHALERQYPLPASTYQMLAEKLYRPLLLGENTVLLCPPLYGRDHNMRILREKSGERDVILGKSHILFTYVYLNIISDPQSHSDSALITLCLHELCIPFSGTPSFSDFATHLKSLIDDGLHPTFIINVSETLSKEQLSKILDFLQRTYYIHPNIIHILLVLDMVWDEEEFFAIVSPFRSLFQNTFKLSLYTNNEVRHFTQYWLSQWHKTLPKQSIETIVEHAGGLLLLAKAAVRIAVREKKSSVNEILEIVSTDQEYLTQLKFVLARLTEKQRNVLKAITVNELPKDKTEILNLHDMKYIEKTYDGFQIRSRSIYLWNKPIESTKSMFFSAIQSSENFSKREKKLLVALLEVPGKTISRDTICTLLWNKNTEDSSSDWAIDKTLSRIRKKLASDPTFSSLRLITQKKIGMKLEIL